MVNNYVILMSIKPKYANQIIDGKKTIELRRQRPDFSKGSLVIIYISSPLQAVMGAFTVSKIISMPVETLWNQYNNYLGVDEEEYHQYFAECDFAYGIEVEMVHSFPSVPLKELRNRFEGFIPPQSYMFWPNKWNLPQEWQDALIHGMKTMNQSTESLTAKQLNLFAH